MNESPENLKIADPKDFDTEYLIVSDTTSDIVKSSTDLSEIRKLANLIRKAGGSVTVFKSTKL